MVLQPVVEEFEEHGQIENSLKMLEYGKKLKFVCNMHKCNLDDALDSIKKATANQILAIHLGEY